MPQKINKQNKKSKPKPKNETSKQTGLGRWLSIKSTAVLEDLSSVASIHIRQIQGFNTFFFLHPTINEQIKDTWALRAAEGTNGLAQKEDAKERLTETGNKASTCVSPLWGCTNSSRLSAA